MDKYDKAHGLFGYEIASGILIMLVLQGQLSKKSAATLIQETLEHLIQTHPDLEQELREIAAKGTAQVEMLTLLEGRRE